MIGRMFLSLFFVIGLAACAGPITAGPQASSREIGLETERARQIYYKRVILDEDRVFNVAFPIFAANASFCERTGPSIGATFWNRPIVRDEFQAAATALYGLHNVLAAQYVADRGPAARAGLRSGDLILAINGEAIERGYAARKQASALLQDAGYRPLRVVTERNGKRRELTIRPVTVCAYPVSIDHDSSEVNAFTDGRRIVVARGMMRFVESDNELALTIAHELGHATFDHIGKKEQNVMIGTGIGLAVDSLFASAGINTGTEFGGLGQNMGFLANSVAFEQEADYVGMYYMERAGYSSRGVADFWRRMAAENGEGANLRVTHPTDPERFLALEATHREIAAKKGRGQKLEPNLKDVR